jgi:hypothetical protein
MVSMSLDARAPEAPAACNSWLSSPIGFQPPFFVLGSILHESAIARRWALGGPGRSPAQEAHIRADKRRDRALTALGWRVLRLDSALVMSDPAAVVAFVQQAMV